MFTGLLGPFAAGYRRRWVPLLGDPRAIRPLLVGMDTRSPQVLERGW
jgi:hypothetical protein